MNGLQVFDNPEFGTIRTLLIEDVPWAVGKVVASALGYSDPYGALKKHVDLEDKQNCQNDSFETPRGMIIVNESGIYSLILSSKLPKAKRFKRWVTNEVLPSIRKTGSYSLSDERPLTRDDYLTAARILSGTRNERLPYVIPLIRKAGIEIELALDAARKTMKDPETAALLDRAVRDYGVSIRVLEKLTGIDSVQLYRMRNGTSRYNAERAALIRDTLRQLVPEMDLGAAE